MLCSIMSTVAVIGEGRLHAMYLPSQLSFSRCASTGIGGAPSFIVSTARQALCYTLYMCSLSHLHVSPTRR